MPQYHPAPRPHPRPPNTPHDPSNPRPRIVQVITHLALGGAEEVAITIAEQLHSQYDFRFFTVLNERDEVGRGFAQRLNHSGIPVHSGTFLDFKKGGALQAAWQLRTLLQQWKPQVVHVHTEIPETTLALALRLRQPIPGSLPPERLIRTVHNSTLWPAWGEVGRWVERQLPSAEIAAVSQASLDGLQDFQNRHRLPVTPPGQGRVIYNGVPHHAHTTSPHSPFSTPLRVLFAGRFEDQKGADLLPALLTEAARLTPRRDVRVQIVGSGEYGELLHTWAGRQQTGWDISVEPPIAGLASQLGQFDVLLLPSRFEGLSLLAIEASLAGVPVVTCRTSGLSEVFDPRYRYLNDVNDVSGLARNLAEILTDPQQARSEVQVWQQRVAELFDVTRMAQGYHQLYAQPATRENLA